MGVLVVSELVATRPAAVAVVAERLGLVGWRIRSRPFSFRFLFPLSRKLKSSQNSEYFL